MDRISKNPDLKEVFRGRGGKRLVQVHSSITFIRFLTRIISCPQISGEISRLSIGQLVLDFLPKINCHEEFYCKH